MNITLSLPDRRTIRAAIGPNINRWARTHGHPPAAVHNTIRRYAGEHADMSRVWGDRTRRILFDLDAAVRGDAA